MINNYLRSNRDISRFQQITGSINPKALQNKMEKQKDKEKAKVKEVSLQST